jgi:hypothetical protein
MNASCRSRLARTRSWIALLTAVALAACTSLRTVPIEAGRAPAGVAPGDKVVITTVAGEQLEFEVVRLDPDAVIGADARVAYEDIAALQVEEIDASKTGGAIFGGGMATFIVLLVALSALVAAAGLPPS